MRNDVWEKCGIVDGGTSVEMQFDRQTTACFSGYRAEKLPARCVPDAESTRQIRQAAAQAIRQAVFMGYSAFITGMCTGFDLLCAEEVLRMREGLGVRLHGAVPFPEQQKNWSAHWRMVYGEVMQQLDGCITLSPHFYRGCYCRRNRFMVDASSLVICYFDGQRGGTQRTLAYARENGCMIWNVADPVENKIL